MQIAASSAPSSSTQKHRKFEGAKLLLVQPLTLDDTPRGTALLAVDSVGAGVGEKVLVVLEGAPPARRSARRRRRSTPRSSASSTRSTVEDDHERGHCARWCARRSRGMLGAAGADAADATRQALLAPVRTPATIATRCRDVGRAVPDRARPCRAITAATASRTATDAAAARAATSAACIPNAATRVLLTRRIPSSVLTRLEAALRRRSLRRPTARSPRDELARASPARTR